MIHFDKGDKQSRLQEYRRHYLNLYRFAVVVASVSLLTSCTKKSSDNNSPPSAPNPKTAITPAAPDPVAEMKKCVQHLETYYNVEHKADEGRFTMRVTNISYDVRKTDSLVTPCTGYVMYTPITTGGKLNMPMEDKLELAYQDNHWVLKRYLSRLKPRDESVAQSEPWLELPNGVVPDYAKNSLGIE